MTKTPPRDVPKTQPNQLRADLGAQGTEATHSGALGNMVQQWGMRDWNTLASKADVSAVQWQPGQRASGRYLGHPFTGVIKAAHLAPSGLWSLTVRFDAPVDVVESEHFTSLRRQVNCTVNPQGESSQKTSDGRPHIVIGPE